MTSRLSQGRHNEKACKYLLKSGDYNDWVVTTAFYSALHYVLHQLLPLKGRDGTIYHSFSKYFDQECKPKGAQRSRSTNKHREQQKLVDNKIPKASGAYRRLNSTCMNARYHNYKVSYATAKTAMNDLQNIKNCLSKVKVK